MKTKIALSLGFVLLGLMGGCGKAKVDHLDSNIKGYAPFGEKAYSPDGKIYAREVELKDEGNIVIYDSATDASIKVIDVRQHPQDRPNDLKGLAWSPDSKRLAVMYHYDGHGEIVVVDMETQQEAKYIPISRMYHRLKFSSDGMKVETEGEAIEIR